MAIKAGQLLFVGNGVVIDRLQTSGPGSLNIPTEKIYELGNYISVATIRDTPDLQFQMESFDMGCEIEAMFTGQDITDVSFDCADFKPVDIYSPWKAGKTATAPFDIVASVGLPFLVCDSFGYRFGLHDDARLTASLRGDSIFYNPGSTYIQTAAGSGSPSQTVATTHPAGVYTDSNGPRRVLSVEVDTVRLTPGVDYTVTEGSITAGFATATVHLVDTVSALSTIRIMYFSNSTATFDQTTNADTTVKPAAVRGRDIDIYIGGYDPTDIPGSAANKWTSVQTAQVDWKITLDKDEEFGNYFVVAQDYDVAAVTGSLDIKTRNVTELFARMREITGVSDIHEAVGPNSALPLELDIVVKDAANDGATLKRINVPDARFSVPGFSGRVQQKLTQTLPFESDAGSLVIYNDAEL